MIPVIKLLREPLGGRGVVKSSKDNRTWTKDEVFGRTINKKKISPGGGGGGSKYIVRKFNKSKYN